MHMVMRRPRICSRINNGRPHLPTFEIGSCHCDVIIIHGHCDVTIRLPLGNPHPKIHTRPVTPS
eukprot:3647415-Karenia_brevis.AAC.1